LFTKKDIPEFASNQRKYCCIRYSVTIFGTYIAYVSLSLKKWPPKYQVIGIMDIGVGMFILLMNASIDALIVSSKVLLE